MQIIPLGPMTVRQTKSSSANFGRVQSGATSPLTLRGASLNKFSNYLIRSNNSKPHASVTPGRLSVESLGRFSGPAITCAEMLAEESKEGGPPSLWAHLPRCCRSKLQLQGSYIPGELFIYLSFPSELRPESQTLYTRHHCHPAPSYFRRRFPSSFPGG